MSALEVLFDLQRGEHPAVFSERLRRVSYWCAQQDAGFRSVELLCPYRGHELLTPEGRFTNLDHLTEDRFVIEHIATRRQRVLAGVLLEPVDDRGRWLCFEHGLSLIDGASEIESGGFFDVYDTPAWDTWVALICFADEAPLLLCWIPDGVVDSVDRGVCVNVASCIYWLDDRPFANTYNHAQYELLQCMTYEAQLLL